MFPRILNGNSIHVSSVVLPNVRFFIIKLNFVMIYSRSFIFRVKRKGNFWICQAFSPRFLYLKMLGLFGINIKTEMSHVSPSNAVLQANMEKPRTILDVLVIIAGK